MKRCSLVVLIAMILFLLLSCDPTTPSVEKDLVLYSNIDSIQQTAPRSFVSSKDIQDRVGEPIVGVLLKYHNEGAWRKNGMSIVPDDPYGFYLKCAYSTHINGDGMEYNYVLFVPDCIQRAYTLSTGKDSTKSGNAFWWYMGEFLGLSPEAIRQDWYSALDSLLNATVLPYPSKPSTVIQENLFIRSPDGMDLPNVGSRQLDPKPVRWASEKGFQIDVSDDFSLFKKNPHSGAEWSYFIFYPDIIEESYKQVKPDYNGESGNPFWWYIKTYYDVTIDDTTTDILKKISAGEFIVPQLN